jgi:AcrR family transcriptional regulator
MTSAAVERSYHHGELRGAMIDEAIIEVREHGLDHLSLRSVATSIGVSPSAAYHHFEDKDELLTAVSQRAAQILNAEIITAVAGVTGDDRQSAILRVTAAGRAYVTFALDEPHLFRAAFSGLHSTPDDPGFQYLIGLLDQLVATNALRSASRTGVEQVLWATVHGIAMLTLEGHLDRDEIPTYLATTQHLLMPGGAE